MAKKKFNLGDFIPEDKNVSNLGTAEISLIPWDRIRVNGENFYVVNDVEELRNSIQMHGLLDPITVTPDAEEGYYLLISGHRRHKAWGLLRDEDPETYARIPAMIRRFESKHMAELALIMANSTARVLTPVEVSRQAERIERLLYELKEEGYEFDGRMRDQVAKACQVSASRIGRLKLIREKLAKCWMPKWDRGKLPEDTAYKLAQLPEWVQERIFTATPDVTARGVEVVGKLIEAGNDYKCADLTGPGCSKCTHGDAFFRHDLEDPWNTCKGKKCCLKCDRATREWIPCSRMCSKAKDKRSRDNAAAKEREAKQQERMEKKLLREIRESAIRLVKAADAAGVDDKTRIGNSRSGVTVKWIRDAAAGEDIGSVYSNRLAPENIDILAAAKALHCSADYVCGLTEELHPTAPAATAETLQGPTVAVWQFGTPEADGRYLCLADVEGSLTEYTCDLIGGQWHVFDTPALPWFVVKAWYPLPAKLANGEELPEGPRKEDADDEEI